MFGAMSSHWHNVIRSCKRTCSKACYAMQGRSGTRGKHQVACLRVCVAVMSHCRPWD